jgi:ABC-2 type transport system permease protein
VRKILRIAKREYLAAVRTKGFIIGLALMPIFMGGSFLVMMITEKRADTADKHVAVIDRSGMVAEAVVEEADQRNKNQIFDKQSGKQTRPAYVIEVVPPDTSDAEAQRLALSDRVRARKLHAFVEIGPAVLDPAKDPDGAYIYYHGENAAMDDIRGWIYWPINNHLKRIRLAGLGVGPAQADGILTSLGIDPMGLVSRDPRTGRIIEARRSSEARAFGVPLVMQILMFMMIMMGAVPLLSSVMEEKSQRIAEVLLGATTPFQFMMGKVLGGLGVSLTGAAVYVAGGAYTAARSGAGDAIPYDVLPWFFAYMVLAILMIGSVLAAMGSTCNDAKEAQSLSMPAMLPVILPMFMMVPVIKDPLSGFATGLSLFPPFTPMLMILRLSTPVAIPAWQPWAGLVGVLAFAVLAAWVGGRIFRVSILMQGKPASLGNLLRWAIRG